MSQNLISENLFVLGKEAFNSTNLFNTIQKHDRKSKFKKKCVRTSQMSVLA